MLTDQQQVATTTVVAPGAPEQSIHEQRLPLIPPATLPCFMVNNLTYNTDEQCKFMIDNECLEDESTFDYVYLVYCYMGQELRYASIVLILSMVIVLFLNLSAVADEFLCPSLLAVAKNLRMSDSLAGVTLLAFGNGCPDIFSSLAAASSGRPDIIVGELLGAGIFCTSIVAGLIFIHNDFKLARRPLIRDATFYLLAVFLIWLYCYHGAITFYGSLAFIIIYVIYLFFALCGQAVHSRLRGEYPIEEAAQRLDEKLNELKGEMPGGETMLQSDSNELENWLKWREETLRRGSLIKWSAQVGANEKSSLVLSDDKTSIKISYQNPGKRLSIVSQGQYEKNSLSSNFTQQGAATIKRHTTHKECNCLGGDPNELCERAAAAMQRAGDYDNKLHELNLNSFKMCPTNSSANNSSNNKSSFDKIINNNSDNVILENRQRKKDDRKLTLDEFREFLWQISPINSIEDWMSATLVVKLILILRAPLLCLTIITVPVVNSEKINNNWNRLLNSIHCITIPIGIVYLTGLDFWGDDDDDENEDNSDDSDDLSSHSDSSQGMQSLSSPSSPSAPASLLDQCSSYLTSAESVKLLPIMLCIALALFVFYTTNRHKAPRYHAIYSYLGFAMSVIWIYKLATEIISILKTVGIMFSMTDAAIGLGVLAWGNSLGDIVANLTLAEAGYARMALAASIGAPLLNLLLGFGLSFSISLKPGQSVKIIYTHTTALLAITLSFVLILLMLSTLAPANKSKRPFGYMLISCYGIYFSLAVCLECGLIAI